MSTNLTGRTKGAGDHFHVAGVEYVWVERDGRLVAEKFDREAFRDMLARVRAIGFADDEAVSGE